MNTVIRIQCFRKMTINFDGIVRIRTDHSKHKRHLNMLNRIFYFILIQNECLIDRLLVCWLVGWLVTINVPSHTHCTHNNNNKSLVVRCTITTAMFSSYFCTDSWIDPWMKYEPPVDRNLTVHLSNSKEYLCYAFIQTLKRSFLFFVSKGLYLLRAKNRITAKIIYSKQKIVGIK